MLDKYIKVAKMIDKENYQGNSYLGLLSSTLDKTSGFKLSKNPQKWTREITDYLFKNFDFVQPERFHVKWRDELDDKEGYGLGTMILEKGQMAVAVPLIVRDFEVAPLDIFYTLSDKTIRPLTEKALNKVFFDPTISDEITDKKVEQKSPIKDIFPPRMGKHIFASAQLEVTPEEIEALKEKLDDKELLAAIHSNEEFMKVLEKIKPSKKKEASKKRPAAIAVESEPTKGYNIIYNDNGIKKEAKTYGQAHSFIKETYGVGDDEIRNKLKQVDGKDMAFFAEQVGDRPTVALQDKEMNGDFKLIEDSQYIVTKTKSGDKITGFVIPNIYDVHTGRITRNKMLIDSNRNIISTAQRIIGKPANADAGLKTIKSRNVIQQPANGSVVSFFWLDDKTNDFAAIEPGKIVSIEEREGEGTIYTLLSNFGSENRIMITSGLSAPNFRRNNKYDAILMPETAGMLVMGDRKELIHSFDEAREELEKRANAHSVRYREHLDQYRVKEGSTTWEFEPREMSLYLAEKNIPQYKIKTLMKEAKAEGDLDFYTFGEPSRIEEYLDKSIREKIASKIKEKADKYDVVKLAAHIDDENTVDALLSLNFANERNLDLFFSKLPDMKETVHDLAELLLASRIAEIGPSEDALSRAVSALQDVVEEMEKYEPK